MIVKVFSATKAQDREMLGERVTEWIRESRVEVKSYEVRQSSDEAFHCLTIVIFAQKK